MTLPGTLRGRLMLLLAAALLPMLGLSLYLHGENRARALAELDRTLRSLLQVAAIEHQSFVDHTEQVLRIMARANDIERLDGPDCSALAARLLDTQFMYVNIGAADVAGRVVCSGRPLKGPANVSDRDWFRDALSRDTVTRGYYLIGRTTGLPALTFGLPLRDASGNLRGALFASSDVLWLERVLAKMPLPPGWAAAALDRSGLVLARHADHGALFGDRHAPQDLALLLRDAGGRGNGHLMGRDGVRRRFVFAPLPATDSEIFLVIAGDPDQVTGPVDRQLLLGLGLIALVAALSFLATWFGLRVSVLRWSERLRAAVQKFGAGDLSVRVGDVTSVAEFAEIGRAFDRMAAEAQDRELLRRQAEEQQRLAAAVFENSPDAIIITDADSVILAVNHAFTQLSGYSAAEAAGKRAAMLNSGRQDKAFYRAMWNALNTTGSWCGEIWNRRKDGVEYPAWLSITALKDADGQASRYIGIATDLTQRKHAEERIRHLAYYDSLTGLPNRSLLADRAHQILAIAAREGKQAAVLAVDVDHFKTVNDSLGHASGDLLLQAVAERMRTVLRDTDTLARTGGDEFVVILAETGVGGASHVAAKLLALATEPYRVGGHLLTTTLSIGISLYPGDADTFEVLLQHADTAMFRAKEGGRNTYQFFRPEMTAAARERLTLENRLRRALARGEFTLHYQPQVHVGTGRLVGLEALLRWHDVEAGWIAPGRFIPVAEDSGLIVPLGEWVLGEACRQVKRWQEAGLAPLPVAVNISANQFRHGDMEELVARTLADTGLAPRWLELELTEGVLMEDSERTLDLLRALKAIGVLLSIDDFGTGYSSLGYLKRFPLDKLKIDQSFVRDLTTDADDLAIAGAVISLGHSLRLRVIAEGVETKDQLAILRDLGCDEAQGYYFARPMAAGDIEALLAQEVLTPPPGHPA
jgi:diguanylate cyclase (GGDEF)-like protein/PAS domain S-box-containing protein